MDFFDTYYNSNSVWGSRGSYILTRFLKSAFTGPVKPTPGTAKNYYEPNPAAGKGFDGKLFASTLADPSQNWPGRPPINIEVQNLALTQDLAGQEDKIILVGINPGNLSDSGSQPNFSTVGLPIGRSSPYQIYGGGSARVVKVTLALHRDMFGDKLYITKNQNIKSLNDQLLKIVAEREAALKRLSNPQSSVDLDADLELARELNYLERTQFLQRQSEMEVLQEYRNTINWFRSLQYPVYTKEGGVIAPRVFMRIGQFLEITGWPNVTVSYENIYTDGFPVRVNIDLQVTETVQRAYDQTGIATRYLTDKSDGMGNYVEWNNRQ